MTQQTIKVRWPPLTGYSPQQMGERSAHSTAITWSHRAAKDFAPDTLSIAKPAGDPSHLRVVSDNGANAGQ